MRPLLFVFIGLLTIDFTVAYLQWHYHGHIDWGIAVLGAVLAGAVYAAVVDKRK